MLTVAIAVSTMAVVVDLDGSEGGGGSNLAPRRCRHEDAFLAH